MDIPLPHKIPLFWSKIDKRHAEECWPWLGVPNNYGYGTFRLGGRGSKNTTAHRIAYTLSVGPIPAGRQLDHLCRNRICCNPSHLEPVTIKVNVARGESPTAANSRKTHCPQGHPYAGENLITDQGFRRCRTCRDTGNAIVNARAKARRAGLLVDQ